MNDLEVYEALSDLIATISKRIGLQGRGEIVPDSSINAEKFLKTELLSVGIKGNYSSRLACLGGQLERKGLINEKGVVKK